MSEPYERFSDGLVDSLTRAQASLDAMLRLLRLPPVDLGPETEEQFLGRAYERVRSTRAIGPAQREDPHGGVAADQSDDAQGAARGHGRG